MKFKRIYILLEILIVFCLPVLFIYSGLLDFGDRFFMALCVFFYVISIVVLEKWRLEDCGFPGRKKMFEGWKKYTFFTAILFVTGVIFGKYMGQSIDFSAMKYSYFNPLYLFILCFTQEFVYRVFIINRLEQITKNKYIIVIISSLIFALLHIMFVPLGFVVGMTFIAGLVWGYLYLQYKNILLLTLSHMLLNSVATYFCLIQGFPGCF